MKIGWIGSGIMGSPMICHLLEKGNAVYVYARHKEKITRVLEKGAVFQESIEELVHNSDVICTMVGMLKDVKEVYEEIFKEIEPGKICIDFTTSSPDLAKELYEQGKNRHVRIMDAPVTGGDVGAENGTLTILVGSDLDAFEDMYELLACFGKNIYHCGAAGSGQSVKIANQIMLSNTLQGICEGMQYLNARGMDEHLIFECLKEGAAGSKQLDLQGEKMLNHDYEPGFYVKHLVKDLSVALEEKSISLTGIKQVKKEYQELMQDGMENLGTQCLIEYFVREKKD